MPFALVPALVVERGRAIETPPGTSEDPAAAATALSRAHGMVYLVDAGTLARGPPDVDLLQRASKGAVLWADVGAPSFADAMDTLVAGAERATLRWPTLEGSDVLEEAAELAEPGAIYLGLEFRDAHLVPNRREPDASPDRLAKRAAEAGVGLVVMSPRYDPFLAGRFAAIEAERWWFGPVSAADREDLERRGYAGAIVPVATLPREGAP